MAAGDLVEVLRDIAPLRSSWAEPDVGAMEDAGVVRPEPGGALAFTVDFITPIVDDPATFGAIAAANSMSDVYAMGGEPRAALAVCGFPGEDLPLDVLREIFRGGNDTAIEAGCSIVGGHTVLDPELKYGLAVIGALGERVLLQRAATPGCALVLTKPLGSGVAAQAIKKGQLSHDDLEEIVRVLTTLNRGAKDAALAAGAVAATDVTGFGLLGHLRNMLEASGHAAVVDARAVPLFGFARELAERGSVPGGTRRNLAWVDPLVSWGAGLGEVDRLLLCDAQTSGGLLIAVPGERADELVAALERNGAPARAVIGEIVEGAPGSIVVRG